MRAKTKLKAGQTLWSFDAKGQLQSLFVVSSKYDTHSGIELKCWVNAWGKPYELKTVTINRFGFLQWDNAYERELHERTTCWWAKVYTTRRAAVRRIRNKRPAVFAFDQISEKYGYEQGAEKAGFALQFIPFYRRDVAGRSHRFLMKVLDEASERRKAEPRTAGFHQMCNRIYRVENKMEYRTREQSDD